MFEDKENKTNNGNDDEQTNDQIESPPVPPENVVRTYSDNASNSNKNNSNQENTKKD